MLFMGLYLRPVYMLFMLFMPFVPPVKKHPNHAPRRRAPRSFRRARERSASVCTAAHMLATCCTYVCGILALLTALFFSPLAFHTPTVVAIDDIKEWGLKGPHRSSLPKNMQGVYYLNGNQVPWNDAGRCNATEAKDKTVCRNGYKRSQLMLFDTTKGMTFDRAAGKLSLSWPGFGVSEHKKHKGGPAAAAVLCSAARTTATAA